MLVPNLTMCAAVGVATGPGERRQPSRVCAGLVVMSRGLVVPGLHAPPWLLCISVVAVNPTLVP